MLILRLFPNESSLWSIFCEFQSSLEKREKHDDYRQLLMTWFHKCFSKKLTGGIFVVYFLCLNHADNKMDESASFPFCSSVLRFITSIRLIITPVSLHVSRLLSRVRHSENINYMHVFHKLNGSENADMYKHCFSISKHWKIIKDTNLR